MSRIYVKKYKFLRFLVLFLIIAIVLGYLVNYFWPHKNNNISESVDYEDLEETPVDSPEIFSEQKDENIVEEENQNLEDRNNKNEADDITINSHTIFIGDSITEGLASYGLIDDKQVIAKKGLTVKKAEKEIEEIVNENPENILILLGANDLVYGMSSEEYATNYAQFLRELKNRLPNVQIYLQSIFPVTEKIETKRPMMGNTRIDEFNNALKKIAMEQGVYFLDLTTIFKDENGRMREEYVADGIHLKYKSYQMWLDYLKKNILQNNE